MGRAHQDLQQPPGAGIGKWAESVDKGDEVHMAVFNAYFADGLNIGDVSVLVELAGSIGLDGRKAEEI